MRRPASQIAAVMMFVAVVADRCIPIYSGCKKKSTDYYRLLVSTIKRFMFQLITTRVSSMYYMCEWDKLIWQNTQIELDSC